MRPDDEDEKTSFADLIGETRPLKGNSKNVAAVPTRTIPVRPARRAHAESESRAPSADRFRYPDPDQPRLGAGPGVSDRQLSELRRGIPAPEERIDLHGTRVKSAQRLLIQRVDSAAARHLRCVLVIHGKGTQSGDGESVLREHLPAWLTRSTTSRSILAFAPAPAHLGGAGATLVLLRKS